MSDLTPRDLGLPAKFARFWNGQEDLITRLACNESGCRFSLLSAPTGSGKSVIYMATAAMAGTRTLVLTSTKGLQAQLNRDFSSMGLVDVRGANNYTCLATEKGGELTDYGNPGTTCDEGPCRAGVRCSMKPTTMSPDVEGCLYYDAVRRARESQLVVTNYAYWMTNNAHADPEALGSFDLLVLDEAHVAPDELASFCAVELGREELKTLDLRLPAVEESVNSWILWAEEALKIARAARDRARNELGNVASDRRKAVKMVKRLTDLVFRLGRLAGAHSWRRSDPGRPDVAIPGMSTDWVAEYTPMGALFSPVWAHAYAEEFLTVGTPRVLLVSAVLQEATARYLGIDPATFEFIEVGSTFDPARRPLIYVPTTAVSYGMTEGQIRIWINRVDSIVGRRLDRKGIIHTRSYDRAKLILERSKYRHLMLSHTTRTTRDVVARFMSAAAPCILVSPSVEEGYDFPGDLVRYQILAKVPFVDPRNPLMKARAKSDKNYLDYLAALSVIQQVGRGMRSADDMCESIIIDDHWAWWRKKAKGLFPRWFRAAWCESQQVPEPLVFDSLSGNRATGAV
jgi:Rad3-related DNA helicase